MKKKIVYAIFTAVLCGTAFFVGKNLTNNQEDACNAHMDLLEITVEDSGMYISITNEQNEIFYDHWITSKELENAGLISTANIIDWNTNGNELAIFTENEYEWYAYKSENIYTHKLFVPIESEDANAL